MPIYGLTDRGLAFPKIGTIRKGRKETREKNGETYQIPVDLDYFVVKFDEQETDAMSRFLEVYGNQPNRINVVFPFNDINQVWSAWLEAHTSGRMIARADGLFYDFLVDTNTGKVVVRNGINLQTNAPHPYEPGKPCGTDKNGKPLLCEPVGRLRVVIPELQRAAYLGLVTGSYIDVANLDSQLKAYLAVALHVGKPFAGIPFILKRTPQEVSVPTNKEGTNKVRKTMYMLSIEAHPLWVEKTLGELKHYALPELLPGPQAKVIELDKPPVDISDQVLDEEGIGVTTNEAHILRMSTTQPATSSSTTQPGATSSSTTQPGATEHNGNGLPENQRPYPPFVLKERLALMADAYKERPPRVDKGLVYDGLCETLSKVKSPNTLTEDANDLVLFITGLEFNALPDHWLAALKRWIDPLRFGTTIGVSQWAIEEATALFAEMSKPH